MEAAKEKAKSVNGINIEQLFSTIDLIKENPDIAKFEFRATNKWINGTHCRGTIKDFYGALEEDDSRPAVDYDMDEPPVLLGNNEGRNPVEYLLVALSGCITTSIVAHASAKGIEIRGVESRYEGDIDLRGFLGLSEDVPVGYQEIRVSGSAKRSSFDFCFVGSQFSRGHGPQSGLRHPPEDDLCQTH